MKIRKNQIVLILSHYSHLTTAGGGPPQDIRDYLLPKVKKIIYIEHPQIIAKDRRSRITVYENNKIIMQKFTPGRRGPEPLQYLTDFFITALFLFFTKDRIDLCISLDCLNTVNILPFRIIKKIKKLIFYTIDYSPQRFGSAILNNVYHLFDKLSCTKSDIIWDLSPLMKELRVKSGIPADKIARTMILPMGANLKRIHSLPITKIKRHQLIFVGILLEKQGLQLIIRSLSQVIKKIPDTKIIIIGDGQYKNHLKSLTEKLKLKKNINFLGFVEKHEQVEKLLCQSAIGLAPYKPISGNYTYFTDPGKPKIYLGCGLPIIITSVPSIAKAIKRHKAGFVIDYSVSSATHALTKLLTDEKLYKKYRENALNLSQRYDTDFLINKAFSKI